MGRWRRRPWLADHKQTMRCRAEGTGPPVEAVPQLFDALTDEDDANGGVEEEQTDGDYCVLPMDVEGGAYGPVAVDANKQLRDLFTLVVFYILPIVGPSIAFWQWKNILWLIHIVLGDERLLLELMQVTLTPATNGIVIACLSIAFGTLTSLTISSLRQRQKEVRQCLNKEACELMLLQAALVGHTCLPDKGNFGRGGASSSQISDAALCLQCLDLLQMYTARLYAESTSEACAGALQRQSVPDTELMGILGTLTGCRGTKHYSVYPIRDEATMRIVRLNDFRSDRLSSINTAFPLLHWAILAMLAASISLCFLVEVDQSEGRFLAERPEDSLRLRLVFTLMIGSFCGLTALCADLNDLFRGSFNVKDSARQLPTMQEVMRLEAVQRRQALQAGCGNLVI